MKELIKAVSLNRIHRNPDDTILLSKSRWYDKTGEIVEVGDLTHSDISTMTRSIPEDQFLIILGEDFLPAPEDYRQKMEYLALKAWYLIQRNKAYRLDPVIKEYLFGEDLPRDVALELMTRPTSLSRYYDYEAYRFWFEFPTGMFALQMARDQFNTKFMQSKKVTAGEIIVGTNWDSFACVERLLELKEIVEVTEGECLSQHRTFSKA